MRRGSGRSYADWLDHYVVDAETGCWLWQGARVGEKRAYGGFKFDGRHYIAHRASYEHRVGLVPNWLVIDHLCRVRHCINPAHLEPVSLVENAQRGINSHVFTSRCRNNKHDVSDPKSIRRRLRGGRWTNICRECERENGKRNAPNGSRQTGRDDSGVAGCLSGTRREWSAAT